MALKRILFLLTLFIAVMFCSCGNNSESVLKKLRDSEIIYTQNAECMLQCLNISKKEVHIVLDSGIVDMEKSNTNGSCPIYIINSSKDDDIQVTVSACDSIANVLDVKHASAKDTCRCN
jgi:hypothetical protein